MKEFIGKVSDRLTERRRDFIWSLIGAIISLWFALSFLKVNEIIVTTDPTLAVLLLPANVISLFITIFFAMITLVLAITSFMMLTNPDNFKD